jgi:uncharacterized protein (TIGR00730 family)
VAEDYLVAARSLGAEIADRGLSLVYGGARIGLMGEVADGVLAQRGSVVGVLPERMVSRGIAHNGLSELIVVDSMHQRKMRMAELADAFVALPGGLGTLEEIFEAITWTQLQLHLKPCGFLNVKGYFDSLLAFLDHCVEEHFVKSEHRSMLVVEHSPASLLDRICQDRLTPVDKFFK